MIFISGSLNSDGNGYYFEHKCMHGNLNALFHNSATQRYVAPDRLWENYTYEVYQGNIKAPPGNKIAGYKLTELPDMERLSELIYPDDRNNTLDFMHKSIGFVNKIGAQIKKHQSVNVYRVRGKSRRIYCLKRTGIVNGIYNGKIVSNISIIEDVTWMRPIPGAWLLKGPGCESFDFKFPEIETFEGVLSSREIEILKLLARGFQTRDIAPMLRLSPHTISTHRKNMLKKLEAANTPELLTLARDMNLI